MGSSIALPALDVKPPAQQPNVLEQYAQLMGLKNQMAMQPLQQQAAQNEVQSSGLQVQQQQQAIKDQQGIANWYKNIDPTDPNAFDPVSVGKNLASQGVSGAGIMNVQQKMLERQTAMANLTKTQIANQQEISNNLYDGINGIIGQTDPQQRASAITGLVQTAAQNKLLDPQTAQQILSNPAAVTDDQLKTFQHGLGVSAAFLKSAASQTDAATRAQEQQNQAPGQIANSAMAVLKQYAPTLAQATDQNDYQSKLSAFETLHPDQKGVFPTTFDPKNPQPVLNAAMSPAELTAASQKNAELAQQKQLAQFAQSQENYRASLGRNATYQNSMMQHGLNQIDTYTADPQHGYGQFVSQAGAVKSAIQSAKNGNQLAASMEPMMLALGVSSFAGVHRINDTEINRAGPAVGSTFRKLDNLLTQVGTGKPTDAQLNEASSIVDSLTDARHNAYVQGVSAVAANTGLDPNKVMVFDRSGNLAPLSTFQGSSSAPTAGGRPGAPAQGQAPQRGNASPQKAPTRPAGVPANAVWNPQGNSGRGSWQIRQQ
jgi:hypothetical protein